MRFSVHIRLGTTGSRLAPQLVRRVKNLKPLLTTIGLLGVADAQRAFTNQKLDKDQWPGRYPNKRDPFINTAGAIRDLQKGTTIKPRRFTRKPAGFDTGRLFGTLTYEVKAHSVVIGSPEKIDYATRFAHGGVSTIAITDTVKKNLVKVLQRARKVTKNKRLRASFGATVKARYQHAAKLAPYLEGKRPKDLDKGMRAAQRGVQAIALQRLGFLFSRNSIRVKNAKRPFLGPSVQGRREIQSAIITYFKRAA